MASLPSPPPAPQRGDRSTFSQRVDAFLIWLVALIPQLNAFLATITSLAAGGANSFSFVFDTATGDANPGAGKVRLGSSTQNSANVLRVALNPANGGDLSTFMTALQAGSSNVKASVRLQKMVDVGVYVLYDVTSVSFAAGYFNLALVPRASSAPNPFVANDVVMVFFDPKGDRGDGGNTPTAQEMRDAIGTLAVANGGTGGTTPVTARASLGVPSIEQVVRIGAVNNSPGTYVQSTLVPNIAAITDTGNNDNAALTVSNGGNNFAASVLQFHRLNQHRAYFGLDIDNQWKVGGGSMGPVAYALWHQGNFNPSAVAFLSGANFTGSISAPVVTETSDERLKQNWRRLTDAQLDALAALEKVGVFDWVDGAGTALGASAQAIRAIVPEAVHEDENGKLTVAYSGLTFAMAQGALRRASR